VVDVGVVVGAAPVVGGAWVVEEADAVVAVGKVAGGGAFVVVGPSKVAGGRGVVAGAAAVVLDDGVSRVAPIAGDPVAPTDARTQTPTSSRAARILTAFTGPRGPFPPSAVMRSDYAFRPRGHWRRRGRRRMRSGYA
jgi:hypothetical protein